MGNGLKTATFYTRWPSCAVKETGYIQADIGLHKRPDGVWAITDLATGMRLDTAAKIETCKTRPEALVEINSCREYRDVLKAFESKRYQNEIKIFEAMIAKAEEEAK